MSKFIAALTAIVLVFFAAQAQAVTGDISASPTTVVLPNASTAGSTQITWASTGVTAIRMTLAVNDGAEATLSETAPNGTSPSPFITAGNKFTYRLYANSGGNTQLLSSVNVFGVLVSGNISASPTTVYLPNVSTVGSTQITWSSSGLSAIRMTLAVNDGAEATLSETLPNGTSPSPFITAGNKFTYRLYANSGGYTQFLKSVDVFGVLQGSVSGMLQASSTTVYLPNVSTVGSTQITWSSSGLSAIRMTLAVNDGAEATLSETAPNGTSPSPFITAGNKFTYRLYANSGGNSQLLGTVNVFGVLQSSATLTLQAPTGTVNAPANVTVDATVSGATLPTSVVEFVLTGPNGFSRQCQDTSAPYSCTFNDLRFANYTVAAQALSGTSVQASASKQINVTLDLQGALFTSGFVSTSGKAINHLLFPRATNAFANVKQIDWVDWYLDGALVARVNRAGNQPRYYWQDFSNMANGTHAIRADIFSNDRIVTSLTRNQNVQIASPRRAITGSVGTDLIAYDATGVDFSVGSETSQTTNCTEFPKRCSGQESYLFTFPHKFMATLGLGNVSNNVALSNLSPQLNNRLMTIRYSGQSELTLMFQLRDFASIPSIPTWANTYGVWGIYLDVGNGTPRTNYMDNLARIISAARGLGYRRILVRFNYDFVPEYCGVGAVTCNASQTTQLNLIASKLSSFINQTTSRAILEATIPQKGVPAIDLIFDLGAEGGGVWDAYPPLNIVCRQIWQNWRSSFPSTNTVGFSIPYLSSRFQKAVNELRSVSKDLALPNRWGVDIYPGPFADYENIESLEYELAVLASEMGVLRSTPVIIIETWHNDRRVAVELDNALRNPNGVTVESVLQWQWRYSDFHNFGELPFSQGAFNALDSVQQASEYVPLLSPSN
jgi:hypothetical protein